MPKKVLTINDFSGGLNTAADERDILPNELTVCTDLDTYKSGVLCLSSKFRAYGTDTDGDNIPSISSGELVAPGYGLFVFGNDFTYSATNGNPVAKDEQEFILKHDGSGGNVDIYDSALNGWATNLFTGVDEKMACYAADGDVFIGGAHDVAPDSARHIKRIDFPGTGASTTLNIWKKYTQAKAKPTDGAGAGEQDIDWTGNDYINSVADNLTWGITWSDEDTEDAVGGSWNNDAEQDLTYIQFATSWLFKEKAESDLTEMVMPDYAGVDLTTPSTGITAKDAVNRGLYVSAFVNDSHSVTNATYMSRTGARLYAKMNTEAEYYQLAELNFEKGIRGDGEVDWSAWEDGYTPPETTGSATSTPDVSCQTGVIKNPPTTWSFFANNTYARADIPGTNRTVYWKHGIVANGRAYIGNVSINNRSYGDTIFYSPLYQYDVFTENNILQVGSLSDGDIITAMATFADRLLVFKKRYVTLVNLAKELEVVETEQQGAGVNMPGAVIRTNFGVVWANSNGCFLYNGSGVINLLHTGDKETSRAKIDKDTWDAFITDRTVVGFDPKRRQVIVLSDANNSGNAYIFSFDSSAWHYTNDIVDTTKNVSNCAIGSRGTCYIAGGENDDYVLEVKDRAVVEGVTLETGEISFGDFESKKNLLKIIIVFNGGASQSMTVKCATNGLAYGSSLGTMSGSGRQELEIDLTGDADYKGKKSFKFQLTGTAAVDFILHDISLVYRDLGLHG